MKTTNENNPLAHSMGIEHPSIGTVEKTPIEILKVAPERFQVRNPAANNYVNKVWKQQEELEMVQKLVSVIQEGKLLGPVLAWDDRSNGEMLIVKVTIACKRTRKVIYPRPLRFGYSV